MGKLEIKYVPHLMEIIMPVFYINVLKWIYLEDENSKAHRFTKSLLQLIKEPEATLSIYEKHCMIVR